MATHSSILDWTIPWWEEPGGLRSIGSQGVKYNWSNWVHIHIQAKRDIHNRHGKIYWGQTSMHTQETLPGGAQNTRFGLWGRGNLFKRSEYLASESVSKSQLNELWLPVWLFTCPNINEAWAILVIKIIGKLSIKSNISKHPDIFNLKIMNYEINNF